MLNENQLSDWVSFTSIWIQGSTVLSSFPPLPRFIRVALGGLSESRWVVTIPLLSESRSRKGGGGGDAWASPRRSHWRQLGFETHHENHGGFSPTMVETMVKP